MDVCDYIEGSFDISEDLIPVFGEHNSDGTRRISYNINISFYKVKNILISQNKLRV